MQYYDKSPDVQQVSDIDKSSKTETEKNKAIEEKLKRTWESYVYEFQTDANYKTRSAENAKSASEDATNKKETTSVTNKRISYRTDNKNGNKETKIEKPK